MKELYGNEIPLWLRKIMCFAIRDGVYRFRWGEISFRWGFSLGYSVYHDEANFNIHIGKMNLFLKALMLIKQRDGTEDWNASFGFSFFRDRVHFNWRTKCKIIYFPWSAEFYKRWEQIKGWNINGDEFHWVEIPRRAPYGKIGEKETHD